MTQFCQVFILTLANYIATMRISFCGDKKGLQILISQFERLIFLEEEQAVAFILEFE